MSLRESRDSSGLAVGEALLGKATDLAQTPARRGSRNAAIGVVLLHAMQRQQLARQIESAEPGILVDVAQDVGELHGFAEGVGERDARGARRAEDAHATAARPRRPPGAIELEFGHGRRDDGSARVHLHAVDDGEEVVAGEVEGRTGSRSACVTGWRGVAGIEAVDLLAPALQLAQLGTPAGRSPSAISSTTRQKA